MENFDANLRESDFPVSQTIVLHEREYMRPCNTIKDDDFPFEMQSQPKPTTFIQDFPHFDQFHANGSSSNPLFGLPLACYDSFEPYPYGCSSTQDMDIYESKPIADNMNGGHGLVMDNFQNGDNNPYLTTIPCERNVFDHHVMGSEQNNLMMIPSNYPEIIKPVNFVMPDEVSCVSAENDCYKTMGLNKNKAFPTRKSWKGRKKSSVVKGQWTTEEDRILIQLVEQYGLRKWSHIAQMLPGRIGKQCRERWHNHLRPDIKKDTWSEEEDKVLIEAHTEIGNKWAEIAKRLPGRTENSIKNHWNATKRRQFSKRKCRSKYPQPSLLQDYIRSLNLEASSSLNAYRRRRKEKNDDQEKQKEGVDIVGDERIVPEFELHDDFGFEEKLLEEGCSIDSLLDGPLYPSAHYKSEMDDILHGF